MVDRGKTEALEGILKGFGGLERGIGVEIGVKKIKGLKIVKGVYEA